MIALIDKINERYVGTSDAYSVRTYQKPGSTIHHVVFQDTNKNYYVKIKRPQLRLNPDTEPTIEALKHEYANLSTLNEVDSPGFAVPRPLFLDAEAMILATSEVSGVPFLRRHSPLKRALNLGRHQLADDLCAIGAALRTLHAVDIPCERVSLSMYAMQFRENISDPIMPVSQQSLAILHQFANAIEEQMSRSHETATCHNDFATHNIIVGPQQVGLLDMDLLAENNPSRDLATLYVSLNDFLSWNTLRQDRLATLWRSFCKGYGEQVTTERMLPFLIHHLANHLFELGVRNDSARSPARRLYLSRLIRGNSRLLGELLQSHRVGVS